MPKTPNFVSLCKKIFSREHCVRFIILIIKKNINTFEKVVVNAIPTNNSFSSLKSLSYLLKHFLVLTKLILN